MDNLKAKLNSQPPEILERIRLISRAAGELKRRVFIVGGFVRDLIMDVKDFDLDITAEKDGIALAERLNRDLNGRLHQHKRFGTASIVLPDKNKLDVATSRKEIYETPASLPRVFPGSIRDDLTRRDFSINAIAVDVSPDGFGQVIDFSRGRQDIQNGLIRVLHDLSFIDDPTRMLRAVRFEQRFGFKIESHTLSLLRQACGQKMLEEVHTHRLRDEFILILKEPQALKCLKRMRELCGFDFIRRGFCLTRAQFNRLENVSQAYHWYQENCAHKHKVELWLLYLMVILEGLEIGQLKLTLKEFAFHKRECDKVVSFKTDVPKVILHLETAASPSHIYKILFPLSYEAVLLILLKADSPGLLSKVKDYLQHYSRIQIHLKGEDLKGLGIVPGPRFQEILKCLLYARLDGKFKDREGELEYLKEIL